MIGFTHTDVQVALGQALAPFGMTHVRLGDVQIHQERPTSHPIIEITLEGFFTGDLEPVPPAEPAPSEFFAVGRLADGRTLYAEVPEGTPLKAYVRPPDA